MFSTQVTQIEALKMISIYSTEQNEPRVTRRKSKNKQTKITRDFGSCQFAIKIPRFPIFQSHEIQWFPIFQSHTRQSAVYSCGNIGPVKIEYAWLLDVNKPCHKQIWYYMISLKTHFLKKVKLPKNLYNYRKLLFPSTHSLASMSVNLNRLSRVKLAFTIQNIPLFKKTGRL